jgi:lipopolysaccharide/colanic/teichoic acid biosynthesis glycosyltransferase
MNVDAEAISGPTWARKNDSRVTTFGRFLRRTRMDELPQFWSVLVGDMSIVGPRPERPEFVLRLEEEIPFYQERLFELRPGITGLAQVNQDYDGSLDDVRSKLLYDHVYASRLISWRSWVYTDSQIFMRTFAVVFAMKGQ